MFIFDGVIKNAENSVSKHIAYHDLDNRESRREIKCCDCNHHFVQTFAESVIFKLCNMFADI